MPTPGLRWPGRAAVRRRAGRHRGSRRSVHEGPALRRHLRGGRRVRSRCRLQAVGARRRPGRCGPSPAGPGVEKISAQGQTTRIGPSAHSPRYSTRSRRVGSAQWMSSNATTMGCLRASDSSSRRTAQNASPGAAAGDSRGRRVRPRVRRWPPHRPRPRPARRSGKRVFGGCVLDDLRNRQIRRSLSVRDAPSDEHSCLGSQRCHEFSCKTRLADSRFPDDRDYSAALLGARIRVDAAQPPKLLYVSPDLRRIQALCVGRSIRYEHLETPRLATVRQLDLLRLHGVQDEPVRVFSEQDGARRRLLLELGSCAHSRT